MRRREFITLLGGAAASWPLVAHAQQPSLPKIGVLCSKSPTEEARLLARFRERQSIVLVLRPAIFDRHVVALDIANFVQPLTEPG